MRGEQAVDGVAHRLHLGRVEVGRVERRREPARDEQRIALAQRDVEVVGEVQHHLPARSRPAGLHEAEMAGGDAGRRSRDRAGSCRRRVRHSRRRLADRGRAPASVMRVTVPTARGQTITSEGIDAATRDAAR